MDFFLVILLGGAIAVLWRRVDRLQTALDELTWRDGHQPRAAAPLTAEPPRAAEPLAPVPPQPGPLLQPATRAAAAASPAPVSRAAQEPPAPTGPAQPGWMRWRPAFDFEDLFGRLLPIWAGGVALAVAGFFLVRWSIEAGLLTVSVRVILGFVFGLALIAAAEFAYRFERRLADPRVRQALAGAGLATLYASFYLAGSFYGLIGSTLAFLGLAAVTAAAIGLSFRFGLPSAVLGLVGGFAAPALVGSEDANLPLLTLYLALVAAGLTLTGRRQDRAWLGIASLAGGLGWGVLLVLTGNAHGGGLVALGALLVLLGAVLPALTGGGRLALWVRIVAAAIAALQLAWLVHLGGFGTLEWGLYVLLGSALAWFGWQSPAMREANAIAAAIGVLLLAYWPVPPAFGLAAVAAAQLAIFAGVPLAQLWRGPSRWLDTAQVCGVAIGIAIVAYAHFGDLAAGRPEPLLALATLALAGFPALAAWLGWPSAQEPARRETLAGAACASALLGTAGLIANPAWAAPLVAAGLGGLVLALARGGAEAGLLRIARGIALAGLALTVMLPQVEPVVQHELARMVGRPFGALGADWRSPLRWLAAALPFVLLARREGEPGWARAAEILATLCVYAAAAQLLSGEVLPWLIAIAGLATTRWLPRQAVVLTLLALSGSWALWTLGHWTATGVEALVGGAPSASEWPAARAALLRLVPLGVFGGWALKGELAGAKPAGRYGFALAVLVLLAALHTLYRQGFAAIAGTDFVSTGMAERTVWEALLLGAAIAAWRFLRPSGTAAVLGIALAAAALAHFAWFTLGLHNPLWSEQAVGPAVLLNWLLASFAAGFGALLLVRRLLPPESRLRWLDDAAAMALIVVLALWELRQAFSGSLLVATPMTQGEDLLRSLTGIVLAIGFLLWGSRTDTRSWRVGSLVLMLVAVLKVFLFDTAGLGGLARIASFMTLGFSLIGIGWFYSRQLRTTAKQS